MSSVESRASVSPIAKYASSISPSASTASAGREDNSLAPATATTVSCSLAKLPRTNLARASRILASLSRRNCPLVTTISPGRRPSRISTMPSSVSMPVRTSRGSNLPSPRLTKATWRSPVSMIAARGASVRSRASVFFNSTLVYMPGFSTPFGLSNSSRTFTCLVFLSR